MPEETDIETKELQETIEELHEERKEREAEEKRTAWTRYIAMSTALLAVIAAIAAMQSGAMVNEAMMDQLKASDTWNEYQSSRLKHHLYTIAGNSLVDGEAAVPSAHTSHGAESGGRPAHSIGPISNHGHASVDPQKPKKDETEFKALPLGGRLAG